MHSIISFAYLETEYKICKELIFWNLQLVSTKNIALTFFAASSIEHHYPYLVILEFNTSKLLTQIVHFYNYYGVPSSTFST